jgi:DnaA family protein
MILSAAQIPLRLTPQALYQITSFHFSQPELEEIVSSFFEHKTPSFLYLWGGASSGKTHLSLAVTEQLQASGKKTVYLPLMDLVKTALPEVLDSLENLDLVCLDEFEAIAGNKEWEEGLFHCFNRLQGSGCQLLIASRQNPETLSIRLADLRSRLATGLIYQLNTLNDSAKQQVMVVQSRARGLDMPPEVAQYLLRHHSRDLTELMQLLHALDKASMAEQRRLTIPFIRQVIHYGKN